MRATHALSLLLAVTLGCVLSCGDGHAQSQPPASQPPAARPSEPEQNPESAAENEESADSTEESEENSEPTQETDGPCPPTDLRVGHRTITGLPARLTVAVARISEDLRALEVLVGSALPTPDARGHIPRPAEGQARFEFEAVRGYRRNPIPLGPLGSPESRQAGLRHPRVLAHGSTFTFSERRGREMGEVSLTHLDAERVCGRVALDDGFGRVQGAFTAAVIGTLPD